MRASGRVALPTVERTSTLQTACTPLPSCAFTMMSALPLPTIVTSAVITAGSLAARSIEPICGRALGITFTVATFSSLLIQESDLLSALSGLIVAVRRNDRSPLITLEELLNLILPTFGPTEGLGGQALSAVGEQLWAWA